MKWLKGKKTYLLVGLGVATVLINALTGDISFMQAITSDSVIQLIELLGLGTIRAGVSKLNGN